MANAEKRSLSDFGFSNALLSSAKLSVCADATMSSSEVRRERDDELFVSLLAARLGIAAGAGLVLAGRIFCACVSHEHKDLENSPTHGNGLLGALGRQRVLNERGEHGLVRGRVNRQFLAELAPVCERFEWLKEMPK